MENSAVLLGDAIVQLLDDPATRQQMGETGRERLSTELCWEKSVAQLLAAYARAKEGPVSSLAS
jgi:glycosyltransferase involved in cell wall biosynthesis